MMLCGGGLSSIKARVGEASSLRDRLGLLTGADLRSLGCVVG